MNNYGAFDILVKEAEALLNGPLPAPDEVSYAPPNSDGSRKNCGNCWKFITSGSCLEVSGEISASQVCSYHVFGVPYKSAPDSSVSKKLASKLAGLIQTKNGGTSCDICKAYNPTDTKTGTCALVQKDGKHASVEAKGCCGRWHEKV